MTLVLQTNPVLTHEVDYNSNNPIIGYHNLVTEASIAADFWEVFYPPIHMANPSTPPIQSWVSSSTGLQYVTVTISDEVDYIAIAGHNLSSTGATVSIEIRDPEDTLWKEVIAAAYLPDDGPTIFRFEKRPVIGVRLRLIPDGTAPRIAVVYCGRLLLLPRRIYVGHTPINFGRQSRIYSPRSEKGNFLGRRLISQALGTSVDMKNVPEGWYRTHFEPFVKNVMEKPFFFAWRPSDFPLEVGYVWMESDPRMNNQRANGMVQFSFDVGGIAVQ